MRCRFDELLDHRCDFEDELVKKIVAVDFGYASYID